MFFKIWVNITLVSYICNFPKKYYQSVYSNNSIFQLNSNITEENLEKLVKNYYEKFDKNIKILEKINIKLNDTIDTSNRLNINKINNSQLPPLLKTLQKIESNIISIPIN
ncbi:hypothetical protein [Spiroplasma endosymbiont of Dasysyrphus albostriatus]|uniref:hypothetical protein n=1 Tax=Spiroplasma endosymbiont of Dasysyrphus albostriatus TaxID=3066299 RepID=UPI0030CE4020